MIYLIIYLVIYLIIYLVIYLMIVNKEKCFYISILKTII